MKKILQSIATPQPSHLIESNANLNSNPHLFPSQCSNTPLPVSLFATHLSHSTQNRLTQGSLLTLTAFIASTLTLSTTFNPTAYAALSATTANTIEGTKPYFVLADGITPLMTTDELLGFTMPDGSGGTTKVTRTGLTQTVTIPVGVKENEIIPLLVPDTTNNYRALNGLLGTHFTVKDDEGDASIAANTSALGSMRVTFLRDGAAITPSNATLSTCASSYQLEIEIDTSAGADAVTAKTAYGAPDKREYTGNNKVTYTLLPQGAGICYIAPFEKTVQIAPAGQGGGGYSAEWTVGKGFSVLALNAATPVKKFPLTGFRNAQFNLIGSGTNQSNYECKLATASDITYVTLSGAASTALGKNCTVTYKDNKIDKTIKIDMYHNSGTATLIDSYEIPIAKLWAGDDGTSTQVKYNTQGITLTDPNAFTGNYDAANYCRGSGTLTGITDYKTASESFFTRAELTNAPEAKTDYWTYDSGTWQKITGTGSAASGGRYTRTADGTFMGEWGYVRSYANSPWSASSAWWTAEAASASTQYVVLPFGAVSWAYPTYTTTTFVAVCKR